MALQRPDLAGIPADVWPIITTNTPRRTMSSLSQTSRLTKRRTNEDYLLRLCRQNVGLKEINNYLNTQPDQFGIMTTYARSIGGDYRYFHIFRRNPGTQDYVETYTRTEFNIKPGRQLHFLSYTTGVGGNITTWTNRIKEELRYRISNQEEDDIWSFIQFDVISLYNILKNRLGCVTRDPGYARKRVLEIFNTYYDEYEASLEPYTIYTVLRTFDMHQYAMMNAEILGIQERPTNTYISAEYIDDNGNLSGAPEPIKARLSGDLKRLQEEIEKLVPLIRDAIDELH